MDSRRTILLFSALVCISMTACGASGPAFQPITDLQEDKALVYVYRPKAMAGSAIKPSITIGDTKMCGLASGGYIVKIVDPGEIEVNAKTEVKRGASLQLERGESGYVEMSITPGIMAGRPKFTVVDNDYGKMEIAKCKKVCGD